MWLSISVEGRFGQVESDYSTIFYNLFSFKQLTFGWRYYECIDLQLCCEWLPSFLPSPCNGSQLHQMSFERMLRRTCCHGNVTFCKWSWICCYNEHHSILCSPSLIAYNVRFYRSYWVHLVTIVCRSWLFHHSISIYLQIQRRCHRCKGGPIPWKQSESKEKLAHEESFECEENSFFEVL